MAARAYWSGQIRLALVSIPVEIYAATRSAGSISFRQIHEPTGKAVRYEKVVAGVGPVDRDEIVKGYEVSKGNFVLLEEDEIEAVRIESRRTLDLVQFVNADDIDLLYYEKPYFVVPAEDLAEEAYGIVRDALKRTRKVGIGQLSVRGREHLVALSPCGRGLVLEILRYADEVARAQNYFRDIADRETDPDLLDMATTIIEKKTAPFEPREFHDRYVDALHRLIDKKMKAKGRKILEDVEPETAPRGGNVIDLMAALKKSLAGEGAKGSAAGAAKGKAPASVKTSARAKAQPGAKAKAEKADAVPRTERRTSRAGGRKGA